MGKGKAPYWESTGEARWCLVWYTQARGGRRLAQDAEYSRRDETRQDKTDSVIVRRGQARSRSIF